MLIFNIILIFLILQLLFNILKPHNKYEVLGCGNFGWTGDDVSKFDRDKFAMLGILNEDRGTDSCGVFVDGKLYKGDNLGSTNEAKFRNLLRVSGVPSPKDIPVVIGHTRNSSRHGIKSVDNTHPFMFDREEGGYFVGAHNGTLKNHEFLAEKYDIDTHDENNRKKVDSEILLEILSRQREDNTNNNIRVLQEYEGTAALIMFSSKNKDEVWMFRGKSKTYTNGQPIDERPIHIWYDQEGSMYWSSTLADLETLSGAPYDPKNENIYSITANTLTRIKGGMIDKTMFIDRSTNIKYSNMAAYKNAINYKKNKQANKVKNMTPKNYRDRASNSKANKIIEGVKNNVNTRLLEENRKEFVNKALKLTDEQRKQSKSIFYERIIRANPVIATEDRIIFQKFRYMLGNQLAPTGVYIYTKQRGFYFLSDSVKVADEKLQNLYIEEKTGDSTIKKVFGKKPDITLFYMVSGVLLKTRLDYVTVMEKGPEYFNSVQLSHMSMYPVTAYYTLKELNARKSLLLGTDKTKHVNTLMREGITVNNGFIKPIGSTYNYSIKDGGVANSVTYLNMNQLPANVTILDESNIEKDSSFSNNLNKKVEEGLDYNEIDDTSDLYERYQEFTECMTNAFDIAKGIMVDYPEMYYDDMNLYLWMEEAEKSYKPIENYINSSILDIEDDREGEDEGDEAEYNYLDGEEDMKDIYNEFGPNPDMSGSY